MERTNKHSTGKDDDLTSKQIFILQLGRINLPQYARNEFLTVIHGVCVGGGSNADGYSDRKKKSE